MEWDRAATTPSAGFRREIPVPLPELGHRFAHVLMVDGHQALVMVVQTPRRRPTSDVELQGPGLHDHGRDRFGVFSVSVIEIRFPAGIGLLQSLGCSGPWSRRGCPRASRADSRGLPGKGVSSAQRS
jgi:hypothetical protein